MVLTAAKTNQSNLGSACLRQTYWSGGRKLIQTQIRHYRVHSLSRLRPEPLAVHMPTFAQPVYTGFNLRGILGPDGPGLLKAQLGRTAALMLLQPFSAVFCQTNLDRMGHHASHNVKPHKPILTIERTASACQ